MAIGFQGDPVPPGSRSGRPTTSHRRSVPLQMLSGGHILELEAVRGEHAHRGHLQGVDRVEDPLDVAGDRFTVPVGQERGDPPLVHPSDGVDVQAGLAFAGRRVVVAPGPQREPPPVVPGPEQQDVALAQPDILRLLDRLQLRPRHRLAGLEPVDAAESGHVEQHPRPGRPVGVRGHVERRGAPRGHDLLRRPAVVDLPLVGDVAQRVHMGVAVAVEREAEVIGGEGQRARADVDVVTLHDMVRHRAGVVRACHRVHRDRHRHLPSGPDQRGRRPHRAGGDVVQRPELVLGTPAPPVLDRLEDLVELPQRHRRGRRQRPHRLAYLLVSCSLRTSG